MSLAPIPGLRERIGEHYRWIKKRDRLDSEQAFAKKYPQFSQHQANDWFSEKKRAVPEFANLVRLAAVFGVTWQELLIGVDGAREILRTQKEIRERRKAEEKAMQDEIGTQHLQDLQRRGEQKTRKAAGGLR